MSLKTNVASLLLNMHANPGQSVFLVYCPLKFKRVSGESTLYESKRNFERIYPYLSLFQPNFERIYHV